MSEAKPNVLVMDASGAIVWDPDSPTDVAALRRALGEIGSGPAASIRADLEIVTDRTARFLRSLADPTALPTPDAQLDQEGVYLHRERKRIAYGLSQEGLDTRREAAPPYHRLLLGARTVHEWGHLAEDAGCIRVADANKQELRAARSALTEAFQGAVARVE